MLTISWLLSSICCLIVKKESIVKGFITWGVYLNPPWGWPIWLGLFMADPDAMHWLTREATTIALSESIDVLVCRPINNGVGMPYGYSIPPGRIVKLGRNEGLVPYIMVCITTRLIWELVGCGGGITISDDIVETNVWFMTWLVTPTVIELLAPPIIVPIGCSSTFGALSWGERTQWVDEFPDGSEIIKNLPLLKRINTQRLKIFEYVKNVK